MEQDEHDFDVFSELPSETRNKWISYLTDSYNQPQRHYHTLNHIHSMITELHTIERRLELSSRELQILHLAIWFHDVVYDPRTNRPGCNEIQSALIFGDYAQDVGLVDPNRHSSKCRTQTSLQQFNI
jgi:predicted metal-dependent HD superfamily phosphohydrolase